MVCVYRTVHGELAPADRLFLALYGACVALLTIDVRRFVDPAFLPRQRHSTTSAKRRWVYNDETWKKLMVTLFAVLCGLGEVVQPIRANVFGTLNEERFLSCIRRVCKSNDHYVHVRLTLEITAIRTRLGLTPDLEEGTKRQKHGEVLFEPLPRGYEWIPMCRFLSLAPTARGGMTCISLRPVWMHGLALTFSCGPILNRASSSTLSPSAKDVDRHMPLVATRALSQHARSVVLDKARGGC
jgi:hypothetical protein